MTNATPAAALNELYSVAARISLNAKRAAATYEAFGHIEDLGRADEKEQLAKRVKAAADELERLLDEMGVIN